MKSRIVTLAVICLFFVLPLYTGSIGCGGGDDPNNDPVFAVSPDGDFDRDGISNSQDDDDDNDNIPDAQDAFQFDSDENGDLDGDGVGNNADADADGDGVDNTADCDDLNASISPNNADQPDGSYIDANCDGMDGEKTGPVWVSAAEGADTNSGAIDAPVLTIKKGLELAQLDPSNPKDLLIVKGTYPEDVVLKGNVSIFGGYSLIADGTRIRDIANNETVISGDSSASLSVVLDGAVVGPIGTTVFAEATSFAMGGLTVKGEKDGAAVLIYDSDAAISDSKIQEYKPTAPQNMNIGVAIFAAKNIDKDRTVKLIGNKIRMEGCAAATSDERDFGVAALPETGAEGSLGLFVENNTIESVGICETVVPLVAADNDDNPKDDPKSDGKFDINLSVIGNEILTENSPDGVIGVMAGQGTVKMLSTELKGIGSVKIEKNKIFLRDFHEGNYAILAALVRSSSIIADNLVIVESPTAGGMWGILNYLSPSDILNNTIYISGQKSEAVGMMLASDVDPNFTDTKLGKVANNNIYLYSGLGNTCYSLGIYEQMITDDSSLENQVSPSQFINNNIYTHPDCLNSALYIDHNASKTTMMKALSELDSIQDAPTHFAGNIAVDPLFKNPLFFDFTLQAGSPCLNAGFDLGAGRAGVDGTVRPQSGTFDIGAYEQ